MTSLGLLLEVPHGSIGCPPTGSQTKWVETTLACEVDVDPFIRLLLRLDLDGIPHGSRDVRHVSLEWEVVHL